MRTITIVSQYHNTLSNHFNRLCVNIPGETLWAKERYIANVAQSANVATNTSKTSKRKEPETMDTEPTSTPQVTNSVEDMEIINTNNGVTNNNHETEKRTKSEENSKKNTATALPNI